ncbi:MAG: SO_0444 family Cu/Zn efflux transporter [Phycisphaeraceae bacterium]
MIIDWLVNTWELTLEASPWLLFGLLAAGLIHAFLPPAWLTRWLGGRGIGAIVRAAVLGAPLPLCSCGVIPAAVALRRRGASRGATVSFLVATPETGVDSVAISYALLGPFMTIARPIAAVLSAIGAGIAAQLVPGNPAPDPGEEPGHCDAGGCGGQSEPAEASACGSNESAESSCCSSGGSCCGDADPSGGPLKRLATGLTFAATDLIDDLAVWLAVGLLLAGAVATFLDPTTLAEWATWGGAIPAMMLMVLVGVPMYICATASTPIAAGLLLAGVSPGTVLVFLLAGPATNLATIGVIRRELGSASAAGYVGSIAVISIALGLLTDAVTRWMGINVQAQTASAAEVIPHWLALASFAAVTFFALRPLRRLASRLLVPFQAKAAT